MIVIPSYTTVLGDETHIFIGTYLPHYFDKECDIYRIEGELRIYIEDPRKEYEWIQSLLDEDDDQS